MSTDGVQMIADERLRQLQVEGWDAEHDRGHAEEIAHAGATYAIDGPNRIMRTMWSAQMSSPVEIPVTWPWDPQWWKPTPGDRIRELVKAGALIAAAIDSMLDEGYVTQAPGQVDMGLG